MPRESSEEITSGTKYLFTLPQLIAIAFFVGSATALYWTLSNKIDLHVLKNEYEINGLNARLDLLEQRIKGCENDLLRCHKE